MTKLQKTSAAVVNHHSFLEGQVATLGPLEIKYNTNWTHKGTMAVGSAASWIKGAELLLNGVWVPGALLAAAGAALSFVAIRFGGKVHFHRDGVYAELSGWVQRKRRFCFNWNEVQKIRVVRAKDDSIDAIVLYLYSGEYAKIDKLVIGKLETMLGDLARFIPAKMEAFALANAEDVRQVPESDPKKEMDVEK